MFNLDFLFSPKINKEYLELSRIAYGGELYFKLKNYKIKNIDLSNTKIKKVLDIALTKQKNNDFYSYKNEESGFSANVYENIKNKNIVIAFRGTERIYLGENTFDVFTLAKDILTDINLIAGVYDRQFEDAFELYNCVKQENRNAKIILTGHSLGGALAQIVASKVFSLTSNSRKQIKLETYTYNAPGCKHLLEIFGCNTNLNYSFITNYSVMNDWCGMFGEKIGKSYLIPPIPLMKLNENSTVDILNNVFLTTHEGIFEYSEKIHGKLIKKPKNFNQDEGLSLWYYDINNPLKDFDSITDFTSSLSSKIMLPDVSEIKQTLKNAAEKFMDEHSKFIATLPQIPSFHSISRPFKKAAIKIKRHTMPISKKIENSSLQITEPMKEATQKLLDVKNSVSDKIKENIRNNMITSLTNLIEATVQNVSVESLENAVDILMRIKNQQIGKNSYIEDLKKVIVDLKNQ